MNFYYEECYSWHGDINFSGGTLFVKINQEYFPVVFINAFETVWYTDKNGKEQMIRPQRSHRNGGGHDGVFVRKLNRESLWWDECPTLTQKEKDEKFRRQAWENRNRGEQYFRDAIFFGTPDWKLR